MRAHIIENGVIINTVIVESLDVIPGLIDADAVGGGIGWSWNGKTVSPPAPAPHWASLDDGKADMRQSIKSKRDEIEASGFPYMGKVIDSDPRSVQRINTSVQATQAAAAGGQTFELEWTCADNSVLVLDAAGMLGMPVALAQHANALHQHARSLKTQVDDAKSIAALEAININTGWPAVA